MAKALIVVDVKRDFCPGGSLAVSGGDVVALRMSAWLAARAAESLLMSVLDEVIFLLDTESSVPIDAEIAPALDGGLDVVVLLAGRDTVTAVGSVPKAISRSELVTTQAADQVRFQFIVDV